MRIADVTAAEHRVEAAKCLLHVVVQALIRRDRFLRVKLLVQLPLRLRQAVEGGLERWIVQTVHPIDGLSNHEHALDGTSSHRELLGNRR